LTTITGYYYLWNSIKVLLQAKPNTMNLIYIHSHDTGRYVQPYGYAVATPHLQHFAEQGILFRNAHCAAPTCSPSRAALLTGQSAHNSGMLGLAHRGFVLHDYSQLLSRVLQAAGFATVMAGGQHVAKIPFADPAAELGYSQILDFKTEDDIASNACSFISDKPAQPFFLDVGFHFTHRRDTAFVDPPQRLGDPRYVRPPAPLPDTPETRQDMADFMQAAHLLDQRIGKILTALDESGLAEDTLVICTTDHGIAFPGMKCSLTDHGTGVMLMMRGPEFSGGKVLDAMISQIDLFPTICEVLHLEKPEWLQGKSMMPLVRGEVNEINEEIFAEVSHHAAYEPKRAVRTRRWKYIRRFGDRKTPVLPNTDDSPSKQVWTDNGWANRELQEEVLFDLLFDPNEANNLAADPAYTEILQNMRTRLDNWMQRTNDPLLQGDIAVPPGGRTTPVDAYSPG
jgi:arylsulfatase A-like enzyme